MAITLNETFRVSAAPDRVWRFLKDPSQVVTCLPGAELTETIDTQTYGGRVKVKVGPITAAYAGRATLTKVDDSERRMQIIAEGKESGGSGQARMTMTGHVLPLADGGSEVSVDAQIDIAGRVMQFGRGLIESVNKQLFKQFADSVQQKLSVEEAAPADSSGATRAPLDSALPDSALPEPMPSTIQATDSPSLPSPPPPAPPLSPPPPVNLSPPPAPAPLQSPPSASRATTLPIGATPSAARSGATQPMARGDELRILPLLWKALVDFVKGIFGRKG
jgi:uncharacterized protein